jgi:hypothetical protein
MENSGLGSVQKQVAATGEPVWVQCEGFRCLAYLNERGEWRTYPNGAKLSGMVKVIDESEGVLMTE